MKEFNVLPTDPRFTELTVEQVDYIISSMVADNKEVEDMSKGINTKEGSQSLDEEFTMESELVLPDAELDVHLSNQLEAMLTSDEERLNDIRANGGTLTEKEVQKLEAISTRRQRLKELDETIALLNKTGKTYDELRGFESPTKTAPTEVSKEDRDYADELMADFSDDDFADLT